MKTLLTICLACVLGSAMAQEKTKNFYKCDTAKQIAYLQDVFKADSSISKEILYKKAKQFVASNVASSSLQLNYDSEQDGKLIFTQNENLFIHQGFGTNPYETKYTFTIEIKQGKIRWTVDNIEFGYHTIVGSIQKRVSAYSEWNECYGLRNYNNDAKRLYSLQEHILTMANNLYAIVNSNSIAKNTDF